MKTLEILSLGAGVQSTTVLMMVIHGELPPLDAIIFADTGWEPPAVYKHLDWLEDQARAAGIPLHRVGTRNIREDALVAQVRGKAAGGERWASMPVFTKAEGQITEGRIRRQCTYEYKIIPIERKSRELMGLKYKQHWKEEKHGRVNSWIGISLDEVHRMKPSQTKWATRVFPLVDIVPMKRGECLHWMHEKGYPEPPRSACIGCPNHDNLEWRLIRLDPELWEDACSFDEAIRKSGGMRGDVFLHRSCVPLREIDFDSDQDRGQDVFAWANECEGLCGV